MSSDVTPTKRAADSDSDSDVEPEFKPNLSPISQIRVLKKSKIETEKEMNDLNYGMNKNRLEQVAEFIGATVVPCVPVYSKFRFPWTLYDYECVDLDFMLWYEKEKVCLTYGRRHHENAWLVRPEKKESDETKLYFKSLAPHASVWPDEDESEEEARQDMLKDVYEAQQLVSDELLEKLKEMEKKFKDVFFVSDADKKGRYARIRMEMVPKYVEGVPDEAEK